MKAWGKDILGIGAAGAVGAAGAILAPGLIGSLLTGGAIGGLVGWLGGKEEEEEEIDCTFVAIMGAMAKIIFPEEKQNISQQDKAMIEQKLRRFYFDEECASVGLSIMQDIQSGEYDVDPLLREIPSLEIANVVARYCVATAIEDGIWSAHEARAFAEVCDTMQIPIAEQEAMRDNALIIYFEISKGIEGWGSGFFINDQGLILTNQHVATGRNELYVRWRNAFHHAEVLDVNEEMDFALVQIGVADNPFLKLAESPVELNQKFSIYGFPEPRKNGYEINVTSGAVASRSGLGDIRTMFRIDAVIYGGNSGGPVLDYQTNEVIGIATLGVGDREAHNFAVKSSEIKRCIQLPCPLHDHESDIEDSVVQLFCGKEIIEEVDDDYTECTYEEMCQRYKEADSSEKWDIFNACRSRGWPDPY
jgi:hypothetical protein